MASRGYVKNHGHGIEGPIRAGLKYVMGLSREMLHTILYVHIWRSRASVVPLRINNLQISTLRCYHLQSMTLVRIESSKILLVFRVHNHVPRSWLAWPAATWEVDKTRAYWAWKQHYLWPKPVPVITISSTSNIATEKCQNKTCWNLTITRPYVSTCFFFITLTYVSFLSCSCP